MIEQYNQVKKFTQALKNNHLKTDKHAPAEVNEVPTLIHADAGVRLFELQQEENFEYREAVIAKDLVEIADGICDSIYVEFGKLVQHGISYECFLELYKEVCNSNDSKLNNGEIFCDVDGKGMKPASFNKPRLRPILEKHGATIG